MATYNLCKTFQDMRIQAEMNYIPGHRGCTILQQLVGLLPSADICGYEHRDNCDFARSRLLCMTVEDDSASKLVANIAREGAPSRIHDMMAEIKAATDLRVKNDCLGGRATTLPVLARS